MSWSLSNVLPHELLADEMSKSIVCNDCGEQSDDVAMAQFHATVSRHNKFPKTSDDNNHQNGDSFLQNEENKEDQGLNQFNNYSVKTLTNLASYPNPNQKMAQRCLDRAREAFKAAAENPRPVSTDSTRPGLNGASASFSSYLSRDGRESSEYYSRVPRNAHMNSSTRSSVLSNGPGAPQPLTAGPPGQRHYKASTLEGPLRVLHESAQKPCSMEIVEPSFGTNPPNPSVLYHLGRPSSTKMPEALRIAKTEDKPPRQLEEPVSPDLEEQIVFGTAHSASVTVYRDLTNHGAAVQPFRNDVSKSGMRETKAQDELGCYYRDSPGCLPYDYDPVTFVSVPYDNSDLQPPPGRVLLSSLEAQSKRDAELARHRERFYAGDARVFRPWECRFDEICEKARDWELGLVDERGPLTLSQIEAAVDPTQLGKPRNISVGLLINQLQPHDAARPLLPMLYSTLANLKHNFHSLTEVQKPGGDDSSVCPRPGYIGQEREERMREQANRIYPPTSPIWRT